MRRIYLLTIALLSSLFASSQQQMMFTQYMFNTQSFNPAYVGTTDKISMVALAREQWVGFNGAPSSQTLTFNLPIRKQKIGLGFSLSNDMIGPQQEINAGVDFSYIIKLSKETRLSFGLKGSFSVYQLNLQNIKIEKQNDPAFSQNMRSNFLPNFGAGLYLYSPKYYVGVSIPRLVKNNMSVDRNSLSSNSKEEIHAFINAGYVMKISRDLIFRPSVLFKYANASPLSVDLAGNFLIKERMWIGGSYRVGDALSAIMQYRVADHLWLGYSYGYSLSKIMNYNSGTHEVMIMYDLSFDKRKFRSPRYF